MNEAPSRGQSFSLLGPDPLEPIRDAIVQRDPEAFVRCFTVAGSVRVPRPEGDVLLRGREELFRAAHDLQSMIRELSWTPSRRFVSAGEVTEEAVVLAHQTQRRTSRAADRPDLAPEEALRIPLRVVATIENDAISSLTLWLDWAALRDPKGVASAGGAASALVAQARSRDERGLRVLQTPALPVITPRLPEADAEASSTERPKPMGRGAVWWELNRATVAGSAMALTALLLLSWVGLNVLAPLKNGGTST